MDRPPARVTVGGVFKDAASASHAVKDLLEAHFNPDDDITVILSNRHDRERVPVGLTFQVGRTASIGTAVGTVAVALGLIFFGPSLSPITMTAGGPLLVLLEGAFIGACVGFAFGALLSIDFAKIGADFSRTRVKGGIVWVGVRAAGARADHARTILTAHGAKHFTEQEPELAAAA